MSEGQQVPRPEDGEIISLSKSDFESLHAEVGYLYIERSLAKKQNEAYIKSISRENAELISRLENSAELLEKSAEEIEALKAYITKLERRAEKASDYIHSLEEKAGIKRELKEEPQSTPAKPDIQDPPPPTNTGDLEFSHTKLTDELNSDIDFFSNKIYCSTPARSSLSFAAEKTRLSISEPYNSISIFSSSAIAFSLSSSQIFFGI